MGVIKKKCLLVCAMPPRVDIKERFPDYSDYFIIAADRGFEHCEQMGITPDLIVGDFDSAKEPKNKSNTIVFSARKDDTDAIIGIKAAIKKGCTEVTIIGGLGGRIDHSYANVQSLVYMAERGCNGILIDDRHSLQVATPYKPLEIEKFDGYLSVFAYSDTVRGVTTLGVEYPLKNAVLTSSFPLGVSNRVVAETAKITCLEGILLVITAQED